MALTPMMKQYLDIKEQYPDSILFYRLGDFYEMFMEDAKVASSILEIALTGRDAGLSARVPMCGIPYHAAPQYIAKLTAKGYKVAICEQVEDPKLTKGIVRREVLRIITPGTLMEEANLKEKENNFIASLIALEEGYALAFSDISTGSFFVTTLQSFRQVLEELERLEVREVVLDNVSLYVQLEPYPWYRTLFEGPKVDIEALIAFEDTVEGYESCLIAGSLLYGYLNYTQQGNLPTIESIQYYRMDRFMVVDSWSRRNLELTKSIRLGERGNTLLWVLDQTKTAAGGRLLKQWLEQPLLDIGGIETRQNVVELLASDLYLMEGIRKKLQGVYDLERILGRLSIGSGNGRDLLALKNSLRQLVDLSVFLQENPNPLLEGFCLSFLQPESLVKDLEEGIGDDPPLTLKEGGLIKDGYNEEVDELRMLTREGKALIGALETREKERLGIKTMKVGYNKVFGYYLEISKTQAHLAPPDYIRKQTIAGGERYINQELKELEYKLVHSREKLNALEYELFQEIRLKVLEWNPLLKVAAASAARLDVLTSFARVADLYNYTKPKLTTEQEYKLIHGRHPVVERLVDIESYIPNDFSIGENNLAIITGPNMAGKSTFIRMLAILAIMAQCGSFVPAEYFQLGLVDRVFARVGASDDLGSGQSTFMVEMNEVASIISGATHRSLIILDEVGRGTSTLDGLAIAWAISEYLATRIKARSVFATHYHELIGLEKEFLNVTNLSMAVQEYQKEVVFLRKVVPGGADKSYGIHVARMAGLPEELLHRAEEQMATFEGTPVRVREEQVVFPFVEANNPLREMLSEVNPNQLTPLEALELLYQLKNKAEE